MGDAKSLFYELSHDDLVAWLAERGEPKYRAGQVLEWAYQHNAASFEEMTNVSKDLREALAAEFDIGPLEPVAVAESGGAIKLLLEMPGAVGAEEPYPAEGLPSAPSAAERKRSAGRERGIGGQVECVAMDMDGYRTACLSSQVGCAIGCAFCASTIGGLERDLSAGEILLQLITLRARVGVIRNVVFMGMGEAFLNYEAVVASIERMIDKRALAMSPRHITVSTAGVVPAIHRYAREGPPTELTVSLNAADQELRDRLMPGVARWDLADLMMACRGFSEARDGQPVTFAYVLLEGVNDGFEEALKLVRLLRPLPHHLNLIPFNEVPERPFKAPDPRRVAAFARKCKQGGLNVSIRESKGQGIGAACGQLRRTRTPDIGPRTNNG